STHMVCEYTATGNKPEPTRVDSGAPTPPPPAPDTLTTRLAPSAIADSPQSGAAPGANGVAHDTAPQVPEDVKACIDMLHVDGSFGTHRRLMLRFVETWTENGKKRSQVVVCDRGDTHFCYPLACRLLQGDFWAEILSISSRKRANIFLGVCP